MWKKAHRPRRVFARELDQLVDELDLLAAVFERLHAVEQGVEGGAVVVGRVLAVVFGLAGLAVEQEEEVLGVGVVGVPGW